MDPTEARAQLESLLATTAPADLGPGPRPGVQPLATLNARIDEALNALPCTGSRAGLIRALLLLWHDHFEPAHALAQDVENRDGSYVHAILHRREPDYSNAKYWFRRVGQHPSFLELALRAGQLLPMERQSALLKPLIHRGPWDPCAFVDACEAARGWDSAGGVAILCEIQRIEFELLLQHLVGEEEG